MDSQNLPSGPVPSQLPLPGREPAGPVPQYPSLSPWALWRRLREYWDSPLVQRALRVTQWWFAWGVALAVGSQLAGSGMAYLQTNMMMGGGGARTIVLYVVSMLVSFALYLAIWIGFPIVYTNWAWRRFWTEAPDLRAAPIPWQERLAALIIPLVRIIVLGLALSSLIGLAFMLFDPDMAQLSGMGMSAGSVVTMTLIGFIGQIITNSMLVSAIVIRRLITLNDPARATGWPLVRTLGAPWLWSIAAAIAAGCCGALIGIPLGMSMAFGGNQTGMTLMMVGMTALSTVISVYVFATFFRLSLGRDLLFIRDSVFES